MADSKGTRLFNSVSDFYSWYMALVNKPGEQAKVFQILSQIMRVAKISQSGGNYLLEEEESTALQSLYLLKEHLLDGKIKQNDVLTKVERIRENLISKNPKAKLVTCVTEVEYKLCLAPKPETEAADLKSALESLLAQVNQDLQEKSAQAITQTLLPFLETVPLQEAVVSAKDAVQVLLDKGELRKS
jgi:hypothetical protein